MIVSSVPEVVPDDDGDGWSGYCQADLSIFQVHGIDRTGKVVGCAFYRRANEKVLLVAPFSSKQERWFDIKCVNIHSGKQYKMVDCTKEKNPQQMTVFTAMQ